MSGPTKHSMLRAAYGGSLSAALVFLTSLQVQSLGYDTVLQAGIAAGVVFVSYMLTRGVAEGYIDANQTPQRGAPTNET